jgi:hypothetical protein
MQDTKIKYNDISKVPVELYDDGVNYGMCYSVFAPEAVIQSIIKLLDSFHKLSEAILLENDTKPPIPLDIFFTAINGIGEDIGEIIGYHYDSNEILDILVTCRGNSIIPFRDTLLDLFPEITYIDVQN